MKIKSLVDVFVEGREIEAGESFVVDYVDSSKGLVFLKDKVGEVSITVDCFTTFFKVV